MGLGVSLFLLAVGAIFAWAVKFEVSGIEIETIGMILMVVGAIGLLFSLLFWSSFAPFGSGRREETTVVRERDREVL
ncbi:MAG: DUF6458 family protein [Actinomycetota bacterium]|nr:DUF6458 family protein [Actinomycetota bacterium]